MNNYIENPKRQLNKYTPSPFFDAGGTYSVGCCNYIMVTEKPETYIMPLFDQSEEDFNTYINFVSSIAGKALNVTTPTKPQLSKAYKYFKDCFFDNNIQLLFDNNINEEGLCNSTFSFPYGVDSKKFTYSLKKISKVMAIGLTDPTKYFKNKENFKQLLVDTLGNFSDYNVSTHMYGYWTTIEYNKSNGITTSKNNGYPFNIHSTETNISAYCKRITMDSIEDIFHIDRILEIINMILDEKYEIKKIRVNYKKDYLGSKYLLHILLRVWINMFDSHAIINNILFLKQRYPEISDGKILFLVNSLNNIYYYYWFTTDRILNLNDADTFVEMVQNSTKATGLVTVSSMFVMNHVMYGAHILRLLEDAKVSGDFSIVFAYFDKVGKSTFRLPTLQNLQRYQKTKGDLDLQKRYLLDEDNTFKTASYNASKVRLYSLYGAETKYTFDLENDKTKIPNLSINLLVK